MKMAATFNFLIAAFDSSALRLTARIGALSLVAATVLHGASRGGAMYDETSAWSHLPGRAASLVGLAADNITLSGVTQHDSTEVLGPIGVALGHPLFGFDADAARRKLEALPWVRGANVVREYPNTLHIEITERKAIAIWQHGPDVDLVDETGSNMGHPQFVAAGQLPLVTGEGANNSASTIINQMSAIPGLMEKVSAAARVGDRRWTLYLSSGVKLALPEVGVPEALQSAWSLEQSNGLFEKAITLIDMRIPGRLVLEPIVQEKSDVSGKARG